MELSGVTAVPSAIKTVDINQDGRSDLLIFKDYGSPRLGAEPKRRPAPALCRRAWARFPRAARPASAS